MDNRCLDFELRVPRHADLGSQWRRFTVRVIGVTVELHACLDLDPSWRDCKRVSGNRRSFRLGVVRIGRVRLSEGGCGRYKDGACGDNGGKASSDNARSLNRRHVQSAGPLVRSFDMNTDSGLEDSIIRLSAISKPERW